ncbi:MAG: amino acid adenylation domain-containing protein [Ignavibacteriaceae bacterium]|jgi:amino acid adenylation domain-containing protein|nr:amino acid adenylation domain-containing protein [Ignavibacteriaceae bacterium]
MFEKIQSSYEKFKDRNAFFINGIGYTYQQFAEITSKIRSVLENEHSVSEQLIGIIESNDIETYCSIFACLFAGKAFVPINQENPLDRNLDILQQTEIKTILSAQSNNKITTLSTASGVNIIYAKELPNTKIDLSINNIADSTIAYILFTSGSTGVPKGVPLTRKNLFSFIEAFFALGYQVDETDKFLQMFDLTFDLSLMCYIAPLCIGACVYPVPFEGIKYTHIYNIMEEEQITFALMVPSILAYIRPYFGEIHFEKVKYSLFCGEALYEDIAKEWQKCVPNALVQNVYGPTEATIFCLTYDLSREHQKIKSVNGIVCIGKPMLNMDAIVVDENNKLLPIGEKGELCLTGNQLTNGYWKNPQKNKEAFFTLPINGIEKIFYRTGDLAFQDDENDFIFSGRIDNQVKIQGFRVELSEIEHHSREFAKHNQVAAIAFKNKIGNQQIHLFVENFNGNTDDFENYLKLKLPQYMVPSSISTVQLFPLNINGKVDRKALAQILLKVLESN